MKSFILFYRNTFFILKHIERRGVELVLEYCVFVCVYVCGGIEESETERGRGGRRKRWRDGAMYLPHMHVEGGGGGREGTYMIDR